MLSDAEFDKLLKVAMDGTRAKRKRNIMPSKNETRAQLLERIRILENGKNSCEDELTRQKRVNLDLDQAYVQIRDEKRRALAHHAELNSQIFKYRAVRKELDEQLKDARAALKESQRINMKLIHEAKVKDSTILLYHNALQKAEEALHSLTEAHNAQIQGKELKASDGGDSENTAGEEILRG